MAPRRLQDWSFAGASGGIVSSTADVAMKTAEPNFRNYIQSIQIAHDTLGAVTEIHIKDGSTIIWRGKLQTPAIEAGSGAPIEFNPPLRGSANTALNVALSVSTTGGVFVNAQGFVGP